MSDHTPIDWTIWLYSQRRTAINSLLGTLIALGVAGLAISIVRLVVLHVEIAFNLIYYAVACAVVVILFAARRLPDQWRALGLISLIYLFSGLSLYSGWLAGSGRLYLLAVIVLGGMLISPRAGLIMAGISFAVFAGFALAFSQGWIILRPLPDPTTLPPIATEGVGLGIAIALVVISQWFFGRALKAATESYRETLEARAQLAERARELEQANEALRLAKERAEQADRAKSQFLASMSHELRTPLNAILNFTEMTAMGVLGPVNERQREVLLKSLSSSRHLLALINDVLDINKMQAGMLNLFVEDNVSVQEELEVALGTVEPLLSGKPITLIQEVEEDLPPISGDRRRIRQILINLLANAARFTQEGSITLTARQTDEGILICVRDTGPGIPKDRQKTLFEPFVQTETGIRHAGGSGLGLAISKHLVEAHGGRLWVESEAGKGSAFYAVLPRRCAHVNRE
jgi:signal transduction histidine kinase